MMMGFGGNNNELDIFGLEDNVVSSDINAYSFMMLSKETGDGKTTVMNNILRDIAPVNSKGQKKVPLFIATESRFQAINGIRALRVRSLSDIENVKNQLLRPEAKEIYSCLVIDTLESLEDMIDSYVATSKGVEIVGELKFGAGNQYIKSKIRFIKELENAGWTIHYITQCRKIDDIIAQTTRYEPKANKDIFHKVKTQVYCTFMLEKDYNGNRSLTCTPTAMYPTLKNGFNMPKKIDIDKFEDTLIKALEKQSGGKLTEVNTVNPTQSVIPFIELMNTIQKAGSILNEKGFGNEAVYAMGQTIGMDKNNNPINYATLVESQRPVAELFLVELQSIAKAKGVDLSAK